MDGHASEILSPFAHIARMAMDRCGTMYVQQRWMLSWNDSSLRTCQRESLFR